MGEKRTYANHCRLQFLEKPQILNQILGNLPGEPTIKPDPT